VNKYLRKYHLKSDQKGVAVPLLLLGVAIIGLLGYFLISSTFPFKNQLMSSLFPKSSSRAAGMVDLSLAPATLTVKQNDTFLVGVNIDTKTSSPSAMDLEVNYDPTVLQATALEPGFFFTKILVPASLTSGKATITLAQDIGGFKSGTGNVATLSFKALQNTTTATAITINPTNTQVASIGINGNDLNTLTNSAVTVSATSTVDKNAVMSLTAPGGTVPATPEFGVNVMVKTGTDASNLFVSKLNFDPSKLTVTRIDTTGSFITQWVNTPSFDNANGLILAAGGVPTPGFTAATNAAKMLTVYFTGKASGTTPINFDPESSVYRDSDNQNIAGTLTSTSVTIGAISTPNPSPSVMPSPSTSVSPSTTPIPSSTGSVVPSSTPVASVIASASPVPSATPSTCVITSANWVPATNPINSGKVVGLTVNGSGSCVGKSVAFNVLEDDGALGTDPVSNQPPTVKFDSNNKANTSWLAEFQVDGFNGIGNPPEYYFEATVDTSTVKSADPLLLVNQAATGTFTKGDANRDGTVDFVDLSILMSNWNKTSGFNDELDYNDDKIINTFDFAGLVQLLILNQLI
jgi:hypothetical protein